MLLHGVIPDTSVLIMSKNRETVLDTLFVIIMAISFSVKVKYIVLLIVVIASDAFEYSFYFKYLNFCK